MENKKYLIAIDLDGTLLKDDKTVSEKSKEYLKYLDSTSCYIVLTSGRALRTMLKYYKEIGLTSPIISYNGGYCHSPYDKDFENIEYRLDKDFLISLYKESIPKYALSYFAEDEMTIMSSKDDDFLFAFFEKGNLEIKFGDFESLVKNDQFVFILKMKDSTDETKEIMYKMVEKLNPNYKIRFWWDCDFSEIHEKSVSKYNTLEILRKKLNIEKDNVIAFGDADNDVEMLSNYKNAYLMKNGNPKLYDKVKNITEFDNEHDGVIETLKKIFK